eukprot:10623129-Lingulodinium_polyedra.AAC.1
MPPVWRQRDAAASSARSRPPPTQGSAGRRSGALWPAKLLSWLMGWVLGKKPAAEVVRDAEA